MFDAQGAIWNCQDSSHVAKSFRQKACVCVCACVLFWGEAQVYFGDSDVHAHMYHADKCRRQAPNKDIGIGFYNAYALARCICKFLWPCDV